MLTEDRVGHYPEFRQFFVRRFSLNSEGLSRPGYVRAPSGMVYALVFVGRSGEPFPDGLEIYALPYALETLDEADLDSRFVGAAQVDHRGRRRRMARRGPRRDRDGSISWRRPGRDSGAAALATFSDHSAASALTSSASWRITPDSGSNWPTQGSRASTALVWA